MLQQFKVKATSRKKFSLYFWIWRLNNFYEKSKTRVWLFCQVFFANNSSSWTKHKQPEKKSFIQSKYVLLQRVLNNIKTFSMGKFKKGGSYIKPLKQHCSKKTEKRVHEEGSCKYFSWEERKLQFEKNLEQLGKRE